jgi:hypothetical protein
MAEWDTVDWFTRRDGDDVVFSASLPGAPGGYIGYLRQVGDRWDIWFEPVQHMAGQPTTAEWRRSFDDERTARREIEQMLHALSEADRAAQP